MRGERGLIGRASWRARRHWQAPTLLVLSALAQLLTFALTIAAAHLTDVASYGRVMGLFGVFGTVAVPTSVIQWLAARQLAGAASAGIAPVAGETALGFRAQARRWLLRVVPLGAAAVSVGAALGAHALRQPRGPLLAIAALAWAAGATLAWWRGQVQGARRFALLGAALLLESAARLAVFVVLLRALRLPPEWALVGALAVAAVTAGAPLLAGRGRADAAPLAAGHAWRTARASLLVSLAGGALASIDLVWARAVLPPVTAGTFAAGTLASRPFLLLASVAGTVALPYAARGTLRLMDLLRAAAGLAIAGTLVALAAWPLAAHLARWIYPSGYAAAAASIRVAALGGAWLAPSLFLATAALGLRRPRGQTTLAGLTLVLAVAAFVVARTPAAFWLLAGGAGGLHLARMAWVAVRTRTPV